MNVRGKFECNEQVISKKINLHLDGENVSWRNQCSSGLPYTRQGERERLDFLKMFVPILYS